MPVGNRKVLPVEEATLVAAPAARPRGESSTDHAWLCAASQHVLPSELKERIDQGANPRCVNWGGEDALMLAARHGASVEVVKFLLGHCSPLARSKNGSTALQMSLGRCGEDGRWNGTFELLAKHSDLSIVGGGESLLHTAARHGGVQECQKLMEHEPSLPLALNEEGSTAMMVALDCKHWQCALILLPRSNPDAARTTDKKTALMIALDRASYLDVRSAAWVEVGQALVRSCDPRKEDSLGKKSVELASRIGHRLPGAVELLIQREAVKNEQEAIEAALRPSEQGGRRPVARL